VPTRAGRVLDRVVGERPQPGARGDHTRPDHQESRPHGGRSKTGPIRRSVQFDFVRPEAPVENIHLQAVEPTSNDMTIDALNVQRFPNGNVLVTATFSCRASVDQDGSSESIPELFVRKPDARTARQGPETEQLTAVRS